MIDIDVSGVLPFISGDAFQDEKFDLAQANLIADSKSGADFTGWVGLPGKRQDLEKINLAAQKIKSNSGALIVIGIGGSYLGARAVIELLRSPFYNCLKKDAPNVYFAGNNLSASYLRDIMDLVSGDDFSINVISKSGSTIETAVSLGLFKDLLEKRYGAEGARERVFVTTGKTGKLYDLAGREGYETFELPADIGGRYSVLTPVGLLPAAAAGIDISELLCGAREQMDEIMKNSGNAAKQYAAARQLLYSAGKKIEVMGCFEPAFRYMSEWFKQLFGESEGKDHKGIFPAALEYSADLHSLGQYIQDGERTIFETFVSFGAGSDIVVPETDCGRPDLAGASLNFINRSMSRAVKEAHIESGVPVIELTVPDISERSVGALIYFLEFSCAVSAYIMGVNPFDQPGVEAYKQNLTKLLKKM